VDVFPSLQQTLSPPGPISKGEIKVMADPSPNTEVLHNENHSKLSAEQIAKAVARNKKNHSAAKEENLALKANKAGKK
jgi:hypothetical protein